MYRQSQRVPVEPKALSQFLGSEFAKVARAMNEAYVTGTATLVAGTVTVNYSKATNNTRIFVSRMASGGTLGHLSVSVTAGTSFTITSTSATDTSTVAYLVIEPEVQA